VPLGIGGGGNSWDFTTKGGDFTGVTNNNTKPSTSQWNFWNYNVTTNTLTLTKHKSGMPDKVITLKPPPNNATLAGGVKDLDCDACETVNSQTEVLSSSATGVPGVPEFGTGVIVVAALAFAAFVVLERLRHAEPRGTVREAPRV